MFVSTFIRFTSPTSAVGGVVGGGGVLWGCCVFVSTFIRFTSFTSAVGCCEGGRGVVCLFLPLLGSPLSRRLWGGVVGVLCVCFYLY